MDDFIISFFGRLYECFSVCPSICLSVCLFSLLLIYFRISFFLWKQQLVSNKKWRHTIQITNDRQVYILLLVNYNCAIISNLYCMMSFLLGTIRCFFLGTEIPLQWRVEKLWVMLQRRSFLFLIKNDVIYYKWPMIGQYTFFLAVNYNHWLKRFDTGR